MVTVGTSIVKGFGMAETATLTEIGREGIATETGTETVIGGNRVSQGSFCFLFLLLTVLPRNYPFSEE